MIILDENIPQNQVELLRSWGIKARKIGLDVGRQGIKDENILPLLHRLRTPSFFTRDLGLYDPRLRHTHYCLIVLEVSDLEVASFARRFLRHPAFHSDAKRMGKVVRVMHTGILIWRMRAEQEERTRWKD